MLITIDFGVDKGIIERYFTIFDYYIGLGTGMWAREGYIL